ncbi:Cell surface glycoprotein 1 [Rhizoctonia solani]|uniref:Cell surface glycoprotein 1 n=1 Tax=Rhizoctonia solani TaxID=456999 RepID=A0A0K6GB95_9AGAM|nr:Cell surface glycoprotein 1 [Rhizoctonia solani]
MTISKIYKWNKLNRTDPAGHPKKDRDSDLLNLTTTLHWWPIVAESTSVSDRSNCWRFLPSSTGATAITCGVDAPDRHISSYTTCLLLKEKMAVEFELPVLQISMAAVDKMQGPDALRALWTVFTKTTGALADGPRLENMTWRLWHRQLLLDRSIAPDNAVAAPINVEESIVEIVDDDDDSGDEWEDDSAPPSRDPTVVPTVACTDKPGVNTRRQSSTVLLQRQDIITRPRRLSGEPLAVLSVSQPTSSSRPAFTIQSRSNSSPDDAYSSHGTNIGRIISHLLPDKLEVAAPASLATQSSIPPGLEDQLPSTPKTQPVQFLIQSPSTPPNPSVDPPAHLPPTLMVINPTPRPTPPATPSTRARAVPTNIPVTLSPSTAPLALAAPSTLSQPHLVLLPCPSASDKLVPAAALPLTPTTVTAPELADEDSKKKIFYVQSPEGAIGSDDGRSHSSSSNSNTTSNVTDAHRTLGGQKASSISSATTDEPTSSVDPPSETAPPPTQDVSLPRGTNHARSSSGNTAYTRTRAARGVKASKPAARGHRGRPNPLVRTTSNCSDKSRGGGGCGGYRRSRRENKQTSASTSHTVTSLPRASPAHNLNMTPANKQAELPRNETVLARVVSSPTARRQLPSHVRSPPNMVARASLVAPFTTIASAASTAPTAHDAPAEAPRPPQNNNSSALMGLGRRAVHVETSSDLDLESGSEESWSDDETDTEDPLARAANEAGRQRSMFEKIAPKAPRNQTRTGLLTNLMNPDPRFFPQAAMRAHNSAQNLAAMRRSAAPAILQTSRSTVAVPKAAAVTAEEVTTHVSVDPTGRAVGGSGSRGLRLQGRPQGGVEEEGSTDEENSMPNELSKTYAQRRLEALATKARVPPPPPMEQVRRPEAAAPTPAIAPRPAPQQPQATMPYDMDVRPIHSPRTVRRKMIAGELSESLRRNLMWERTSTRFAMGAGALGSGLRPLAGTRPGIQTTNSDRVAGSGSRSGAEDDERAERRLALARNKSWANDFHHAGW